MLWPVAELLDAALDLHLVRLESVLDVFGCADAGNIVLHLYEVVLLLDYLLEPGLINALRVVHIHANDQRACKLALEPVYLAAGLPEYSSKVLKVALFVHALCADHCHLQCFYGSWIKLLNLALRWYIKRLSDLLRTGHLCIIKDVCRLLSYEYSYAMDSVDLLHLCLESHCTSVAFQGAQAIKSRGLEMLRGNFLGIPLHIDGRKLDLSACPDAEGGKGNCKDSRNNLSYIAYLIILDAHIKSSVCTGSNALTAKRTVNMVDSAVVEGSEVDVIWTHLCAKAAVVAGALVLKNVENLIFRSCIEHLKTVADDAECSQEYSPRNVCSHCLSDEICSEQYADPHPELEGVGNGSELTEIAAPEHIHSKASDDEYANGND